MAGHTRRAQRSLYTHHDGTTLPQSRITCDFTTHVQDQIAALCVLVKSTKALGGQKQTYHSAGQMLGRMICQAVGSGNDQDFLVEKWRRWQIWEIPFVESEHCWPSRKF